jgi:hypothetical protein
MNSFVADAVVVDHVLGDEGALGEPGQRGAGAFLAVLEQPGHRLLDRFDPVLVAHLADPFAGEP